MSRRSNNGNKKKRKKNIVYVPYKEPSTFEEAKELMIKRLSSLKLDLYFRSPAEKSIFTELCKYHEDKKHSLMDFYARNYSPCRISETVYTPKGQGDMNDVMIDFSEGYDKFVRSMEEEYAGIISRRRSAAILFNRMLSVKYPYSRIMYLYYYMNLEPSDISNALYISRSTFFRLKSMAVNHLVHQYYPELYEEARKRNAVESDECMDDNTTWDNGGKAN